MRERTIAYRSLRIYILTIRMPVAVNENVYDISISLNRAFVFGLWVGFDLVRKLKQASTVDALMILFCLCLCLLLLLLVVTQVFHIPMF